MKRFFEKSIYKPRFKGYFLLSGFIKIIDGICSVIVGIFGYDSSIWFRFAEWNIITDIKLRGRRK